MGSCRNCRLRSNICGKLVMATTENRISIINFIKNIPYMYGTKLGICKIYNLLITLSFISLGTLHFTQPGNPLLHLQPGLMLIYLDSTNWSPTILFIHFLPSVIPMDSQDPNYSATHKLKSMPLLSQMMQFEHIFKSVPHVRGLISILY